VLKVSGHLPHGPNNSFLREEDDPRLDSSNTLSPGSGDFFPDSDSSSPDSDIHSDSEKDDSPSDSDFVPDKDDPPSDGDDSPPDCDFLLDKDSFPPDCDFLPDKNNSMNLPLKIEHNARCTHIEHARKVVVVAAEKRIERNPEISALYDDW
jgi:hypothetical protein